MIRFGPGYSKGIAASILARELKYRRGHRSVLHEEFRHILLAAPEDTVGWASMRVGWFVAGTILVVAVALFAKGQMTAHLLRLRREPNWYSLAAFGCMIISAGVFIGTFIKAGSDLAIVFDHNVGLFYYGKYQPDPARVPSHAKPLNMIQHVDCYEGYKIGQVGITLSEPEGKRISVLAPRVGETAALAEQLAEFLGVPVVEAEKGIA